MRPAVATAQRTGNMIIAAETIAHKYAVAFYNVYGALLTESDIQNLDKLAAFFKQNRSFVTYISNSNFSCQTKQACIEKIVQHYKLQPSMVTLLELLGLHKRLELLYLVLQHISRQYYKRHFIARFTVKTSHVISEQEKTNIASFVQRQISNQAAVKLSYFVAPELISGIQIKGDVLLWERSVRKMLQNIKRSMLYRIES